MMTCEDCMAFLHEFCDEIMATCHGTCALSREKAIGFLGCQVGESIVTSGTLVISK